MEKLKYELFPIETKEGERLPLLVWMPGEEGEGKEAEKAAAFLKSECRQRRLHLLLLKWDESISFRDLDVCKEIQLLLFDVRKKWHMDVNRTYLLGYSEGAAGVWQLLASYPRMLAAGVAISGYGDPYRVRNAKEVPIWAFHGSNDEKIPTDEPIFKEETVLAGSAWLVQALRNVGASSNIKYTELSGCGHLILNQVLTGELMDWLCMQNRKKVFRVNQICNGVWKIDDYFMASCYLVEGKEKALLIDTGLSEGDFMGLIKSLTDLPVSLAVTHPHRDHMYHSNLFQEIFIHHKAAQNFKELYGIMQNRPATFDSLYGTVVPPMGQGVLKSLHDGDVIELDDTCKITAAFLPGHTEYDCVFVDDSHRCVFTGDAVGSGYTVGIPMAEDRMEESLSNYKSRLQSFLEKYGERIRSYSFLGGHFIQENGCDDTIQEDYLNGRSHFFIPLSLQVFKDMIILCDRIMEGKAQNEGVGRDYSFAYRSARIGGTFMNSR